jgi:uncharacterized protein YdcH (DUF465 family)
MDDFRLKAKADFVRLLEQHRQVERWIKRAEQVNQKAIIPAMNELRYASRQLYNALQLFDGSDLTPGIKSSIKKRLIIAEQYLLNAEHDIWDAIVGYYDRVIRKLDDEFGISTIAILFPGYPMLREKRFECLELITEAREFYERRSVIYCRLRTEYFPLFVDAHNDLLDAEISARESRERLRVELERAHARASRLEKVNLGLGIFGAVAGLFTIIGVILSVYLWLWARDEYCEVYSQRKVLGAICRLAPPPKPTPHTGESK